MPGVFAKLFEPTVEVRVVQIASNNSHWNAEDAKHRIGDFPVAEVPADHQDRAARSECSPARLAAVTVMDDLKKIIVANFPRKLRDFNHDSKQMDPHAVDVLVDGSV